MSEEKLNKQILVLTRTFQAVEITTVKPVMILLCTGRARVVDEDYAVYTLEEWIELKMKEQGDTDSISTPHISIEIPDVVQLVDMDKPPRYDVKFSFQNIKERDNYTCQYCMAPDHKVLTSDLKWVALGDLEVGDSLVGFDEESDSHRERKFREAIVESHIFAEDELYQVTLDDGTQFRVTKEHKWLARKRNLLSWVRTDELQGLYVPKLFNVWSTENTREAGWTAGVFDGEGSLSGQFHVTVAQNPGQVLERLKQFMRDRDIDFGSRQVKDKHPCIRLSLRGGYAEKVRFLGSIRPERLIENFRPERIGTMRSDDYRKVATVESIGLGEIVKMRTSSSTFIADGFPHHNCYKEFPSKLLTVDHVHPKSKGGKSTWENCVAACYPCNTKKADHDLHKIKMQLLKKPKKPAGFFRLKAKNITNERWKQFING